MIIKKYSFAIELSILLLAIMFSIQGCSESAASERSNASTGEVQQVLSIRMGDYYYKPDTIRIPAGKPVLLKLTNEGTVLHEFTVGQKFEEAEEGFEEDLFSGVAVEMKIEGKPVAAMEMSGMHHEAGEGSAEHEAHESMEHEEAGESEAHEHGEMGHSHLGTMLHLEPGQTGTMQFTLPAPKKGTWKIGCFLKTAGELHYDLGMEGALIVQ